MSNFERVKELNEKSVRASAYINKLVRKNGLEIEPTSDCDYDFGTDYVINELKNLGVTDISLEVKDLDNLRRMYIGADEFLFAVSHINSEKDIEALCDRLEMELIGLYFQILYLENNLNGKNKK